MLLRGCERVEAVKPPLLQCLKSMPDYGNLDLSNNFEMELRNLSGKCICTIKNYLMFTIISVNLLEVLFTIFRQ